VSAYHCRPLQYRPPMPPTTLPLVTIVTPTYNQAEYLAQTIDSILSQDYPNIEYLVLDDGSTDATPEVLRQYDGRVRWERQQNMGQSRTLNKGWSQAKGEFIGYLSSDDLLLPNAVSRLVAELQARPDAAVVYCDFHLIDAKGQRVGHVQSPDYDRRQLVEDLICHPGPGALFRRSVFEQVGGWNENLRKIPDFEFWLRVSRVGSFFRIPETLAEYRVHEESTAIRPLPIERSMEIVDTMRAFWGSENSASSRYSMSRAHFKAARNHAQSGRVIAAFTQFLAAARLRPKTLVSVSSWRGLLASFLLRLTNRFGRLSALLR
jgi:glycosyltransferase involved in cell wall biosynthesis